MVPNIAANGASFTGAGAYYLHDKPFTAESGERINPVSTQRVALTATRNLANDDAETALIEMWRTAEAQPLIKAAAGVEARGRKCTDPVKTISLAWHPDERPTHTQMIDAADGFLAHMGWAQHQALYVVHNDTAHAHIHIILNRVHPETGRTLDDFRERLRAQGWAKTYERENGHIRCPLRETKDYDGPLPKNERRIPNALEKEGRGTEQPFLEASELMALLDGQERDLLHELQTREREAFFATAKADFRAARQAAFHEVRAEFKAQWRQHFNDAKMLRAQARELAGENAATAFRLAREGKLGGAWQALESGPTPGAAAPVAYAERHIAGKAKDIAEAQKRVRTERQASAATRTFAARNERFLALKARQKDERTELRAMADAHGRGEAVDIDRLRALLTGETRRPTEPNQLLRQLATVNDNAAAIDRPPASNDNHEPARALEAARVRIAGEHMAALMASVQMTNSPGMAATQTAALKQLTRRTRQQLEHGARGSGTREITDRVARLPIEDARSAAEQARDRDRYGADNPGRDRGGGRDR